MKLRHATDLAICAQLLLWELCSVGTEALMCWYILEVLSQVEEIFWFTILVMSLYQLPQLESCGHDILKYLSLYTEGKEYVIRRTQSSSFLCV